jgi:hypothetical protein
MYPYLPNQKVKAVILDCRATKEIKKNLNKLEIDIILTPKCKDVYSSIEYHSDIMIHFIEKDIAVVEPNIEDQFIYKLEDYGIKVILGKTKLSSNYPNDIAYNVARVGKFVFHNFKNTDIYLKDYFKQKNLEFIDVAQGYSKCSICILTNNSIITSDKSIHTNAIKNNINSLLIRSGYINLEGLNYGFIGGCSGKISENKMVFSGNIEKHPDYIPIKNFLEKYQVDYISLSNEVLLDVGSIIPIF